MSRFWAPWYIIEKLAALSFSILPDKMDFSISKLMRKRRPKGSLNTGQFFELFALPKPFMVLIHHFSPQALHTFASATIGTLVPNISLKISSIARRIVS